MRNRIQKECHKDFWNSLMEKIIVIIMTESCYKRHWKKNQIELLQVLFKKKKYNHIVNCLYNNQRVDHGKNFICLYNNLSSFIWTKDNLFKSKTNVNVSSILLTNLWVKIKKQVILRERKICQLIQVDLFAHTLFLLYIAFQLSRKKFYGMLIVLFWIWCIFVSSIYLSLINHI